MEPYCHRSPLQARSFENPAREARSNELKIIGKNKLGGNPLRRDFQETHRLPKDQIRALAPRQLTRKERQRQVLLATSTAAFAMIRENRQGSSYRYGSQAIKANRQCTNARPHVQNDQTNQMYHWNKAYMHCLLGRNKVAHHYSTDRSLCRKTATNINRMADGDSSNHPVKSRLGTQTKRESRPCDANLVHKTEHANQVKGKSQPKASLSTTRHNPSQRKQYKRSPANARSDTSSGSTDSEEQRCNRSPDRIETRLTVEQPVLVEEDGWDSDICIPLEVGINDAEQQCDHIGEKTCSSNDAKFEHSINDEPELPVQDSSPSTEHSTRHCEVNKSNLDERDRIVNAQPEPPHTDREDRNCCLQLISDVQVELRKSTEIAHCTLDELVTTERSYCRSLYVFSEIVAKNVCMKSGVSLKELRLLFPRCLPDLYAMHVELLEQMEASMKTKDEKDACPDEFDCSKPPFIVLLESLEQNPSKSLHTTKWPQNRQMQESRFYVLYKRYFSEFTVAMETMRKLTRQSSRFRQTIKRLQQHPDCEGFDFSAFLLAPVQRLPRYLLLMKQLTRHLRRIAQNPLQVGQTRICALLSMSERCEKLLHSVLLDLDSQLAEHRENNKRKSITEAQETIRGPGEIGPEVTNANGNHCRTNPSHMVENSDENFRSLWPRVRRAFSDKRNMALSEIPSQEPSLREPRPEELAKLCQTATAQIESDVVDYAHGQSYDNAIPVGRYLVKHQSEDDLLPFPDGCGTQSKPKIEKLVLMSNPVQDLVSCVKAGTISVAVRRNSRRQTVGEVTWAMQKALANSKAKNLSLDRQEFPVLRPPVETSNPCVKFDESPVTHDCKPDVVAKLSVISAQSRRSRTHADADVKSNDRDEVENSSRIGKKVNRVNTFPTRRFPLLRLQRRQSEPCTGPTKHEYSPTTAKEATLIGPRLEPNRRGGKARSVTVESSPSFSTLSTSSVSSDSATLDRTRSLSNGPLEKSTTENVQCEQTGFVGTAGVVTSRSCAISEGNSLAVSGHRSDDIRPTVDASDATTSRSRGTNLLDPSVNETSSAIPKKAINNLMSALRGIFRRKASAQGDRPPRTRVRNTLQTGSVSNLSPQPIKNTPSNGTNTNTAVCTTVCAPSMNTVQQQDKLIDSVTRPRTDEHVFIQESQILSDPPEMSHEDRSGCLPEMSELVFLDETGNPCFDI